MHIIFSFSAIEHSCSVLAGFGLRWHMCLAYLALRYSGPDLEVCAEILGRRCDAGEREGQRCHRHAHDETLQSVVKMSSIVRRPSNLISCQHLKFLTARGALTS